MATRNHRNDDLGSELQSAFSDIADALREVAGEFSDVLSRNASEGAQRFRSAVGSKPDGERQAGTPDMRSAINSTKALFGGALRAFLCICGGALVFFAVVMLAFTIDMFMISNFGSTAIGAILAASAALGGRACFLAAKRSRLSGVYMRYIGARSYVSVRELAGALHKSERAVRAELADLIRHGAFREAYLTPEEDRVYFDGSAFRAYMQSRQDSRPAPQPQPQAAPAPRVRFEEEPLLRQLAAERRRIDDIPVRSEVEKLEHSAAEIFEWVRRHPSDASQVRRVTSYYLPTTLKLLRTYNEMDLHAESSAVAEDIQNKIRASLVSINEAFGNLLDMLLQDTALDVDAEISALSTVLAQEGLFPDEISRG